MRTLFKLMCVAVLCALPRTMVAQYSFQWSLNYSGNCNGISPSGININATGFATQNECERARSQASLGVVWQGLGCTIRVTTSPCTGRPLTQSSASALSGMQLGDPSQGTAYFSTNPSDEVSNWAQDNAELLGRIGNREASPGLTLTSDADFNAALQSDLSTSEFGGNSAATGFVLDPDKPFVSLNMRHPEEYASPDFDFEEPDFNTHKYQLSEYTGKRFDDEEYALWRDWVKLGGKAAYTFWSMGKVVATTTALGTGLLINANVNLYGELYRAAVKGYRGEEIVPTGTILMNAVKATVQDYTDIPAMLGDKAGEKALIYIGKHDYGWTDNMVKRGIARPIGLFAEYGRMAKRTIDFYSRDNEE